MIEDSEARRVRKENAEGSSDPTQEKAESLRTNAVLRDLEREGLIKKLPFDRKKIDGAMALAHRDAKTSRAVLANDHDWAYTIAYNAILQAGRALMFAHGYRPDGANQHISVVKFAELYLEGKDAIVFDRMRRKRHSSVYDTAGAISATEAEFAVGQAGLLIDRIEALLKNFQRE
jgi:uncharacterized protein (UPF0332 family)